MSVVALLVLPALAGAQSESTQAPRTVTLQEAIDLTLQYHPQVAQAAGTVRTSVAAERTALGAWFPTLSLSAGGTLSPKGQLGTGTGTVGQTGIEPVVPGPFDPFGTPVGGVKAGVAAAWEVYSGGRRSAEQARSRAAFDAAQSQLVSTQSSTAYIAQTAFFDELRSQQMVGVAKARVDRAKEALGAAQKRFSVGSATRSDVLRAELELNTAQQALLTEETNRRTASFALGRLTGSDEPVSARADTPVEPGALAVDDQALMSEIVASAPVVLAAEGSVRASTAGVTAARSKWLPSLQLGAGYNWANSGFNNAVGYTGWNVQLGVSYPVFDGFVRDEVLERARVQDHVASTQLADTRRMVRSEAERALGQVKLAKDRIALAEKAVEVGAEDLRVQQERYGLGVSTILDLLQSQTSLVEAETNLVTARFDYQLARAQLEALAGRKL